MSLLSVCPRGPTVIFFTQKSFFFSIHIGAINLNW